MNAEQLIKNLIDKSEVIVRRQNELKQAASLLARGIYHLREAKALPIPSTSRPLLLKSASDHFYAVYFCIEKFGAEELQDALQDVIREVKALSDQVDMCGDQRYSVGM